MSSGILSIGASALNAAYTALRTTGNNIANVNTPGYSREVTSFSPQISTDNGGIYIGTGVAVDAISRVYSDFLGQQTNLAQASASQADSTAQLTGQINSMFSDTTTGLGAVIDKFFTQIQALSANPGSAATRQTTLSAAQEMAGQFNNYYAQLQSMSQSAQQQIGQEISSVNTTVGQIASLNSQISLAAASGQTPNTLLDQRNLDILTLNKSIGVTTSTQSNGAINVYLANGQPLLVGNQTFALTMGQDPANPQNVVVGTSVGGTIAALDPNNSGGGAIGALLQFQTQTIPNVENQIGQLALSLASQFNALQAQGMDQNGNVGSNLSPFFATPTIGVTAAPTNAGTLAASYGTVGTVQASNYQLSVLGGNYTLTRLSDGTTVASGALGGAGTNVQADGMTLNLSASTASGDTYTIAPQVQLGAANIGVALTQGSQIAAASPLQASVGPANQGSLAVGNLSLPANPSASLLQPVTLTFSNANTFTYTIGGGAPSAPQTYTPGTPISINGWSLTLTGAASASGGDVVSVTASGSSDNRNALAMAQLQGQSVLNGATLDSAYSTVVANVGALASTAQTDQTSKDAILQHATTAQSSVSGVNLDEEASNMLQFQQQYQAAAQLIMSANATFTSLITAINAA
ncbi:putative Flagellar hook-associated protein [Burkholderiales bacterium]|nr:putative Flagellar hook-associated protein [Burkholderiales bacterium]